MEKETFADDKLKDIYELTRLYDIYGALLNDHNRIIFEDYVLNNYSLGEIATDQDISRQGVRDTIQRCSKKLREYEDRLSDFLQSSDEAGEAVTELENYIQGSEGLALIARIKKTLDI